MLSLGPLAEGLLVICRVLSCVQLLRWLRTPLLWWWAVSLLKTICFAEPWSLNLCKSYLSESEVLQLLQAKAVKMRNGDWISIVDRAEGGDSEVHCSWELHVGYSEQVARLSPTSRWTRCHNFHSTCLKCLSCTIFKILTLICEKFKMSRDLNHLRDSWSSLKLTAPLAVLGITCPSCEE